MLDRMAHGTVHAVSALVTGVPARRRLDWRTPVRWFGLLCLMGAAFFAGYVAWLLWGTGLLLPRDLQWKDLLDQSINFLEYTSVLDRLEQKYKKDPKEWITIKHNY